MDDMERYGDYNELDEAPGGNKNIVAIVIKVLIGLVCAFVIGIILFRLFLFNYYPKSMKSIYFTDSLAEYYEACDGDIGAETQELRFPYDDADDGNFFCDNLILVREAGQLQLSLRFNQSFLEKMKETLGHEINPDTDLVFSLAKTLSGYDGDEDDVPTESVGTLAYSGRETLLMYTYYKLAFDEVDFGLDTDEPVSWIRLEVRIKGHENRAPFCILVYENHSGNSSFSDYNLSSAEVPNG